MARMVKHEDTHPVLIEMGGEKKWICMCGLTKTKPFRDGSHRECSGEEEGKMYTYNDGERSEVKEG